MKRRNNVINKIEFFQNIKGKSVNLSRKQLKIADYIFQHYYKAAFLTAEALASEIGVSESTVVRFAVCLGYEGYPDFQSHLQKVLLEELTSTQRLKLSIHSGIKKDILTNIFLKEVENINLNYKNISRDEFMAVVDIILKSKRIFITGLRASTCLAQYFIFQLGRILENVIGITSGGRESWEIIRNCNSKDLLIAIAFPRYPRETVELIDYANQLKMHTAGITDRIASPITERCELTLYAPFELLNFIDLYSAPLTLIEALISEVALRNQKKTFSYLKKFEKFIRQANVYYK